MLACLWTADSSPRDALRLLAVADRARERLGAPMFVPDERAARADAEAAIRAALGDQERRSVVEGSAGLELHDVVREQLLMGTVD